MRIDRPSEGRAHIHDPSGPRSVLLFRFLAELEMKLHLTAEDASLYLQDHSSRAVTRIPAATKELLRIKVGQL